MKLGSWDLRLMLNTHNYDWIFFSDPGGIQFSQSIETQNIRSGPGNSLLVSSPVGKLKLNGPQKVDFSSFAGPINLFGLEDITLKTKAHGKVSFNAV